MQADGVKSTTDMRILQALFAAFMLITAAQFVVSDSKQDSEARKDINRFTGHEKHEFPRCGHYS